MNFEVNTFYLKKWFSWDVGTEILRIQFVPALLEGFLRFLGCSSQPEELRREGQGKCFVKEMLGQTLQT